MKGNLRKHLDFWVDTLRLSPTVLGIIKEGPLFQVPPNFYRENDNSVFEYRNFVDKAVKDLLKAQCIRVVVDRPCICSPLLVVKSAEGKMWLVINLKYLNWYLWKQKFKYEDLRTALSMLEKGDFLFKFDLKSRYHMHHIEIHKEHVKYLGFSWDDSFYSASFRSVIGLLHFYEGFAAGSLVLAQTRY